jgi:ribonucleotide monophosphatase NagD (HAD superfamily)
MMVCNPDKIRPDADKSPMPGTIGVTYEELLKQKNDTTKQSDLVLYLGKPFADVYEIALQDYPGKRACMVGDALETDVTGAQAVGIDSIWVVKNGVHNDDVAAKASTSNDELEVLESGCRQVVKEFNRRSEETYAKGQQLTPTIVIPYFSW